MEKNMDIEELATEVQLLKQRMEEMEKRVVDVNEAVQTAVATMMPKMDALLTAQSAGTNAPSTNGSDGSDSTNGAIAGSGGAQQTANAISTPSSLLEAAMRDDVGALARLLMAGADVKQRDPQGNTALHLAAILGHLAATSVFVGFGAPLDLRGRELRTPLHCAAAYGRLQVARRLLDAGARADVLDLNENTALFLAATKGHADIVTLLLPYETSVDVCSREGDTLLMHATKAKQWAVVEMLVQKGASAIEHKKGEASVLVLAAKAGQADVVRNLLWRIASDREDALEALKVTHTSAVVWAFTEALPEYVVATTLSVAAMLAAEEGRLQPLAVLLETGLVEPDTLYIDSKQYLLHLAAAKGHLACVKKLLVHGATIDAIDTAGDSPLHMASRAGHVDCARALVDARASTTLKNNNGKTPVEEAKNEDVRAIFQTD